MLPAAAGRQTATSGCTLLRASKRGLRPLPGTPMKQRPPTTTHCNCLAAARTGTRLSAAALGHQNHTRPSKTSTSTSTLDDSGHKSALAATLPLTPPPEPHPRPRPPGLCSSRSWDSRFDILIPRFRTPRLRFLPVNARRCCRSDRAQVPPSTRLHDKSTTTFDLSLARSAAEGPLAPSHSLARHPRLAPTPDLRSPSFMSLRFPGAREAGCHHVERK